jgi:hypothetical protein
MKLDRSLPLALLVWTVFAGVTPAHEGHHDPPPHKTVQLDSDSDRSRANAYLQFFQTLITRWPLPLKQDLISQAWMEHRYVHDTPAAPSREALRRSRTAVLRKIERTLPSIQLQWRDADIAPQESPIPLRFCRTLPAPLCVTVHNVSETDARLRLVSGAANAAGGEASAVAHRIVPAGAKMVFVIAVAFSRDAQDTALPITIEDQVGSQTRQAMIPIQLSDPATIRGSVRGSDSVVPARVTVIGSDGICRYGDRFGTKATLTDKPIIYPPVGVWQKTSFFYTDGRFEVSVPPGTTRVVAERGFHHQRHIVEKTLRAGESLSLDLSCDPLVEAPLESWVSGDTHVHWVTNQWNVDEPLELLAMVQRAEGLRVANNLTLLQRYANQAFIKPSQAPMGPVAKYSGDAFHIQMGEEYRNENLYGHLCFLNIDWLVQPIGTGSIIAGPDALDYPINRTAIEACRRQGGISIEAHGTGGNKDVPVNVIHNLTDSLDQMEPEMYYRLLDCGFRLPLTNGSDHPARTLGVARAYVKLDGEFAYWRWIEGIRHGRTFTTSGPLIFLSVNGAEIGDVVSAGAEETLKITANVVSRDPIGRFQIVSNGRVIGETQTDQTATELNVTMPAGESRWVVARCSRRTDGRQDFGFGNFNAITGPGIAHTSPVYVQVDGRPRFDPAAAAYWRDRMRQHVHEVRSRGRFANQQQRQEAVDYLQQGMTLFEQLETFIDTSRALHETLPQARRRLSAVIRRFGDSSTSSEVLRRLSESTRWDQLHAAVRPLVQFRVSVNPESRVKIESLGDQINLLQHRPQRFLIEIENAAGITAPLNLSAIDLAVQPPRQSDWCSIEVVDSPFTSRRLTGAKTEYKVVEVTPHAAGWKELRITGDAGQGTQDLGFRATADVLLDIQPKREVLAE